jgi:hypothetical protein
MLMKFSKYGQSPHSKEKLLPILLHEVFEYSEASEFHQVWRGWKDIPSLKRPSLMAFPAAQVIYPYEDPTLSIANIERWILKSAIVAQKEQPAKQSVTLTITSLIDQDIVTFTPLSPWPSLHAWNRGPSLPTSFHQLSRKLDARALKGLHVAKTFKH